MARRRNSVDFSIVKDMLLAWALTFPCCGLIGYLASKLFILVF
jgi:PiT family inorganic phosphate transporter